MEKAIQESLDQRLQGTNVSRHKFIREFDEAIEDVLGFVCLSLIRQEN